MSVLESMQSLVGNQISQATRRYAALLHSNKASPENGKELAELAEQLHLSPAEVIADFNTVRQMERLQKVAADGTNLGEKIASTINEVDAFRDETARIIAQRKAELIRLEAIRDDLTGKDFNAQRAINDVNALIEFQPRLFEGMEKLSYETIQSANG